MAMLGNSTTIAALAIALIASLPQSVCASEPAVASPWVKDHSTAVRLIGGGAVHGGGSARLFAGLEIRLDEGWKTYWRNPGSSGVPPRLDWKGSENLAAATVLFPAPERFADKEGDTVGYKKAVLLPIAVQAQDPTKPVVLKLALEYGVCREVCIPVQPNLTLTLSPDAISRPAGSGLVAALATVPRAGQARLPSDPVVKVIKVDLAAAKPSIVIDVEFSGTDKGADVFLEAPEGLWIPLAKPIAGGSKTLRRFEVDLTDGADIADLKGRTILLTLVSEAGQSEASFKLE
ncbi:MAG: protein-disulfide reductase DsbD domain-containing protein [Hyphomicrobiaceae bacterium]